MKLIKYLGHVRIVKETYLLNMLVFLFTTAFQYKQSLFSDSTVQWNVESDANTWNHVLHEMSGFCFILFILWHSFLWKLNRTRMHLAFTDPLLGKGCVNKL